MGLNPSLTVEASCGGAVTAGSSSATHVDRTFAPGTYYVIVGGQRAASAGAYTLNATVVPM